MNNFNKNNIKWYSKILFFAMGIGATVWFLIRVIPKPGRAAYPCMRATAPVMSAFVMYMVGVFATASLVKVFKKNLLATKVSILFLMLAGALFSFNAYTPEGALSLNAASYYKANQPVGEAKGIYPGRVVWVADPLVTNENTKNSDGDFWSDDKNTNQRLVESMLDNTIKGIAGKDDINQAWEAVFKYFNKNHGKGEVGYTPGEKVAVKINITNSCCFTKANSRMDATPQLVLALLKQLVDVVGVYQSDIWIGDSYRYMRDEYYTKCHDIYPNVHYVDGQGGHGREKTVPSAAQLLVFSDGVNTSSIPQHIVDAAYLINMPCLKSHESGGITIGAKNHQGSFLAPGVDPADQSAYSMHYCLPDQNPATGQYRHLTDYMGHKQLGGKTLLYIVDAIWAGKNWEGYVEKWAMKPFNNDYPSSLLVSQDAVAIESVCYDFLLAEYANKSASEKFPYMTGVDDYMKYADDPSQWPDGIIYDPEGDGTPMESLGVYEHWNNADEKKYSRNLGTGNGIELLKVDNIVGVASKNTSTVKVYPNPFVNRVVITSAEAANETYKAELYSSTGQLLIKRFYCGDCNINTAQLCSGTYLLRLTKYSSNETVLYTQLIKSK